MVSRALSRRRSARGVLTVVGAGAVMLAALIVISAVGAARIAFSTDWSP